MKFSSCLVEIEMCDAGIKNRKSIFFFSFAHGSNQIVGHRDFLKLEQLQNKDMINLKVSVKEFILHSAVMHF